MQRPKPRVEYSEKFQMFADNLITRCAETSSEKVRMTRRHVNALAAYYGFAPLTNPNQRALRELMGERGYKIQIGAAAVFLSRLPVTNVEPAMWPALIDNICQKLGALYHASDENTTGKKLLRMTPAKFRNIATIWPADNLAFNQACIEEMFELGYTMIFRVNYIDVCAIGDESKPGKRKANVKQAQPLITLMNGRALLEAALHPRRLAWRAGFSHALMINAKGKGSWASTALSRALLNLREPVHDSNGTTMTTLALNHGDVLLVNAAAYALIKSCTVRCLDSGSVYEPDILARALNGDSVND